MVYWTTHPFIFTSLEPISSYKEAKVKLDEPQISPVYVNSTASLCNKQYVTSRYILMQSESISSLL